jgi:ankyrin repeat protein
LIRHGANVNARAIYKVPENKPLGHLFVEFDLPSSPLGAAVLTGNLQIVNSLLGAGASVNASNSLQLAAKHSKLELCQLLVDNGGSLHSIGDHENDGWSLLHTAAYWGNTELVNYLIRAGAMIDMPDNFGRTPLVLASESGQLPIVKLLEQDPKISHSSKGQALVSACSRASYPVAEYLLDAGALLGAIEQVLHEIFYIANGKIDTHHVQYYIWNTRVVVHENSVLPLLRLLVKRGADINCRDRFGNSWLHNAAYVQQSETVRLLLANGAAVDSQNNKSQTALDIAARFGGEDVFRPILHSGAEVTKDTLLHVLNSTSQIAIRCLTEALQTKRSSSWNREKAQSERRTFQNPSRNFASPTEYFASKLHKAAKFLAIRGIDDIRGVKLSTEDAHSFMNDIKAWIEEHTGTAWIWWPLMPRVHPLKPGEVWLEWHRVSLHNLCFLS